MPSGPARVPLVAPSLLRMYGLRSAIIFVVMIVALGAGTLMLREAATGAGHRRQQRLRRRLRSGDRSVARRAGRHRRGAERRRLLRRLEQRRDPSHRRAQHDIYPYAGNHDLGSGFSGDDGPASDAQLDTPDGVAIAPDGDLIVADSHNDRIRRVDRPTGVITTIAGSGENGYDGDEKPAIEAALNTPSAVAAAPNGDIYIADTLNYRVRMIDAKTGLIHTVAGDGTAGRHATTSATAGRRPARI